MFILKYLRAAGAFAVCAACATSALAADLKVRIEGVADSGTIHVYVFTSAEGFPKEEHAVAHVNQPGQSGAPLDVSLHVPDSLEYALMAYQDKNGDGKMNRFLGMIPQEPYALSRNPQVLGKPKFSDAAVRPMDGETIVLKLHD